MRKLVPDFELYVTKSDLSKLSGNDLISVLDSFVNLEGFLTIHETEDADRRVAHKANLALLQTFKLDRVVSP